MIERRVRAATKADRRVLHASTFRGDLAGSMGCGLVLAIVAASFVAVTTLLAGGSMRPGELSDQRTGMLVGAGLFFVLGSAVVLVMSRSSNRERFERVEELTAEGVGLVRLRAKEPRKHEPEGAEVRVLLVDSERAVLIPYFGGRVAEVEVRSRVVLLRAKDKEYWGLASSEGAEVVTESLSDRRAFDWAAGPADPEVKLSEMPGRFREVCEGVLRRVGDGGA